jgi:hypothetical protein
MNGCCAPLGTPFATHVLNRRLGFRFRRRNGWTERCHPDVRQRPDARRDKSPGDQGRRGSGIFGTVFRATMPKLFLGASHMVEAQS